MAVSKHLPESELDIMLVIWDGGDCVPAPAILDRLGRTLTASVLHSYLKRLEEKGFLSCTKVGKVNTYTALVTKEEYQRSAGTSMLQKLYNGSIFHFAAALYDGKALDREELEQLQALLDRLSAEDMK